MAYPLPNIEHAINLLGGNSYFSSIDLASAFHQIELSKQSRHKTAFSTGRGLYEFLRTPFGLMTSPACMQKAIERALAGLAGTKCIVYIDDIIIFSKDREQHFKDLREVLNRLNEVGFKANISKCKFLQKQITCLGHIIDSKGILPTPDKVQALISKPIPTNLKELRSFMGLANYYRKYIKNFATITLPLSQLTKKNCKFIWTPEHTLAIDIIKSEIISPQCLVHPNFDKKFKITCDASTEAIGAVLSQEYDGHDRPIAFFSRNLHQSEKNYSIYELEALSIKSALSKWRVLILGYNIEIYSDNQPAISLLRSKQCSGKIARFLALIQEFNCTFKYIPGKSNVVADFLSRNNTDCTDTSDKFSSIKDCVNINNGNVVSDSDDSESNIDVLNDKDIKNKLSIRDNESANYDKDVGEPKLAVNYCDYAEQCNLMKSETDIKGDDELNTYSVNALRYYQPWTIQEMIDAQKNDPKLSEIILALKNKNSSRILNNYYLENDCLFYYSPSEKPRNGCLCIPSTMIPKALELIHSQLGGHEGIQRTQKRAQKFFVWDKMYKDIADHVKACKRCLTYKPSHLPRAFLRKFPEVCGPFNRIAIDLMGPFPVTRSGKKYIFVAVDIFSHWVEIAALTDKTTINVAKALVNNIIYRHGSVQEIISDQGSEFNSALIADICELLEIKKLVTSAYHPSSNGMVERINQEVTTSLRTIRDGNPTDWDSYLPQVQFFLNSAHHGSIADSPFFIIYGRDPVLPLSKLYGIPTQLDNPEQTHEKLERMKEAFDAVRKTLEKAYDKYAMYYNRSSRDKKIRLGDLVFKKQPLAVGPLRKFKKRFTGPFRVIDVNKNGITFKIKKLSTGQILYRHQDNLRLASLNQDKYHPFPIIDQNDIEEEENESDVDNPEG